MTSVRAATITMQSVAGKIGDGSDSWFANAISRYNITGANIRGQGCDIVGSDKHFVWLIHD